MKFLKSFAIILSMFAALNSFAQVNKLRDLIGSGTNGRIAYDEFGGTVAVSGDVIVVGASYQDYDSAGSNKISDVGAAYIFYKDQGGTDNWGLIKKITGSGTNGRKASDKFGTSIAISGDIIVVGAPYQDYDSAGGNYVSDAGAAYIYIL